MMKPMKKWRENWKYPTCLVCIYGFFTTIRPIDPFLVAYLTGPLKNLTSEEVNNVIFPMGTYGQLVAQVPVFLLTDWLRHKPVAILDCMALFITTAMTRWSTSVPEFQASEFCFGVASACKVAYFSYIYSMVDLSKYRRATSYLRCVQLLGQTVGSVLGQLIFTLKFMSFHATSIMILVFVAIGLFTSFIMPMPKWSMFFHRKTRVTDQEIPAELNTEYGDQKIEKEDERKKVADKTEDPQEPAVPQTCGQILLQMVYDTRDCFKSRRLLYWSLWWILATCGFNQAQAYSQAFWQHLQPGQNSSVFNGAVDAVSSLLSAGTVYGIGFAEAYWEKWDEMVLAVFSGLCAGALYIMTFSGNIWVGYASYIIFKCIYMVVMTLAMFHIAVDLTMERHALVFGANNFLALCLQSILTAIVVNKTGLGLTVVPQYILYSSYFLFITVIFLLRGLYVLWNKRRKSKIPVPSVKNELSVYAEHKF